MCGGNNAFSDFFIRPDRWLREHRDEAKIAAIVAAAVAAPYVVGAAGAAGGAGAAAAGGVGAAEAGAAGLTAAEYAALTGIEGGSSVGFAAGASGAGTGALEGGLLGAGTGAGELAADAALTAAPAYAAEAVPAAGGLLGPGAMDIGAAVPYGGELSSVGDIGGTMLGGAQPQNVTALPGDWSGPLDAWERVKQFTGSSKGIKALQAAQQFSKLTQPAPLQTSTHRPAAYQGGGGADIAQLQALYANPAAAERLKYLLRARGVQV